MRQSRARGRQHRERLSLQDKGYRLCAFGVAAVVVPLLVGSSPMLAGLSAAVGPIGWMALAGGLGMLVLHRLQANKSPTSDSASPDAANAPRSAKPRAAPTPVSVTAPAHPATHWSPAVFAAIEWRRFEAVCEALFAQAGFETKSQSHGADGGVDIWLHSRNADGPVGVVQCKHWQSKSVSVKEMREFFGVMAANKLTRGTYATTSSYTPDAAAFAKANGINALDGKALLALIAKRSPEQQQALLAVAHEGDYWRPTCASCGIKLIERPSSKGGRNFWGCSNYPKCKSTLPMVGALR